MRVATAFNRILALPGASVATVSFTDEGLALGLHRRRRRLVCPCGRRSRFYYDRSRRRWRHLDFGTCKVFLEAEVHRIDCQGCGRVRTEQVPWARPGARHTRDFEDVVAWLAQRMDKTSVARLLRCSWEAVDRIVNRVVVEHIDDTRLDGLLRIGVDEVSYKRGHRYLTIVADHDSGRVVWVGKDRNKQAHKSMTSWTRHVWHQLGSQVPKMDARGLSVIPFERLSASRTAINWSGDIDAPCAVDSFAAGLGNVG